MLHAKPLGQPTFRCDISAQSILPRPPLTNGQPKVFIFDLFVERHNLGMMIRKSIVRSRISNHGCVRVEKKISRVIALSVRQNNCLRRRRFFGFDQDNSPASLRIFLLALLLFVAVTLRGATALPMPSLVGIQVSQIHSIVIDILCKMLFVFDNMMHSFSNQGSQIFGIQQHFGSLDLARRKQGIEKTLEGLVVALLDGDVFHNARFSKLLLVLFVSGKVSILEKIVTNG
mmetsp:Transcript_19123/g.52479  ORF Transcript_19123/g.52479 Transcript_19123/m.52479 type:complete len:230 (-) Transcript_19123:982-1671(-)